MSQFKFACPVCGQHITADSANSGEKIECPTCFQKIIVPAERSADSKLIFSATKAEPRKGPAVQSDQAQTLSPSRKGIPWAGILLLLVVAALAAVGYKYRDRIAASFRHAPTNSVPVKPPEQPPQPLKFAWTLDPMAMIFPDTPVAGTFRGAPFKMERATLQGGVLSFRQGKAPEPEQVVVIALGTQNPADLAGKSIQVISGQPKSPMVTLRRKEGQEQAKVEKFSTGYALKLTLGAMEGANKIPGQIYLCLPDEEKSFIAGRFTANISRPKSKPRPPAQRAPAPIPPKAP